MSEDEFINYCELHSTTERSLFHSKHVGRLLALAGDPYENADVWNKTDRFVSVDLRDHCTTARQLLASRQKGQNDE